MSSDILLNIYMNIYGYTQKESGGASRRHSSSGLPKQNLLCCTKKRFAPQIAFGLLGYCNVYKRDRDSLASQGAKNLSLAFFS